MASLDVALRDALTGRACVVGVGNSQLGDDGVGPRVAEALSAAGHANVIVAETTPERFMEALASSQYDNVLFIDAVEFEGDPGAALLMDATEIETHFPQVSTHKLSLGTVARLIRRQSGARVHLLGVRPQSLAPGVGLSAPVEESANGLATLLGDMLTKSAAPAGRPASESGEKPVQVKCEAR